MHLVRLYETLNVDSISWIVPQYNSRRVRHIPHESLGFVVELFIITRMLLFLISSLLDHPAAPWHSLTFWRPLLFTLSWLMVSGEIRACNAHIISHDSFIRARDSSVKSAISVLLLQYLYGSQIILILDGSFHMLARSILVSKSHWNSFRT